MACWRGQPPPRCGGFFLAEMQGVLPLARPSRQPYAPFVEAFDARLEWNLGYMVNVTDRWAVGGAVSLGPGAEDVLTGLKARVRRWLGPELSVELEGGMLRTRAGFPDASGFTADARLNVADRGSLFVRWEGVDVPSFSNPFSPFPDNPGGFEQAVYVGAATGSTWAVATTGALGVGYLVVVAFVAHSLRGT